MQIKNSVVVITGASSGIGRAAAIALAKKGAYVVLASRQEEVLRDVARECEKRGGKALAVKVDVNHEKEVQRLAEVAIKRFGRIDVWINNAAVSAFGRFDEIPPATYDQVIHTNLFGYIYGARAVIPHFRYRGRGVLINVSSMAGKIGAPFSSAYNTSKFAVTGFSESLRMEFKNYPEINVSTVMPASVDTPFFQHAANYMGRAAKPMEPVYNAQSVVRAIMKCIERPVHEIFVGNSARLMTTMRRVAPRAATKVFAKQVEKNHFENRAVPAHDGNVFSPLPASVKGGWRGHDTRRGVFMFSGMILAGVGMWAYRLMQRQERLRALSMDQGQTRPFVASGRSISVARTAETP